MAGRDYAGRRAKGIRLLQAGISQAEVARRLDISRAAVHLWHKRLKAGQDLALFFNREGRPPQLSNDGLVRLRDLLESDPLTHGYSSGRWTLSRIAALVESDMGICLSVSQISRITRSMGWDTRRSRWGLARNTGRAGARDSRTFAKLIKLAHLTSRVQAELPGQGTSEFAAQADARLIGLPQSSQDGQTTVLPTSIELT